MLQALPNPSEEQLLPDEAGLPTQGAEPQQPQVPERWVPEGGDDEVSKAKNDLDQYQSAQEEWSKRALANDEFRNGLQWRQADWAELFDQGRPTPVVNVLAPAVEQAKSMLTSNRPRFDVSPRGDEDRKAALVRSVYLSHVWDQSHGSVLFDRVVDDYYVRNRGHWFPYWDPSADGGRGGVRIAALDPLQVYPDPNSRDKHYADASQVFTARPMTRAQIGALWPHFLEELDGEGKPRIEYAEQYSGSRVPWTGQHGNAAYGGPYVGDDGDRGFAGGMPAQDDLGKPPIGDVRDGRNGAMLDGEEHDRYEVVSRFKKVHPAYHTVYDAETGTERRMDAAEYDAFRNEPGYVIVREGPQGEEEDVFLSGEGLDDIEALYLEMGGTPHDPENPGPLPPVTFHLVQGPEELDPVSGMMVPGAPVPLRGPERGRPGEILGSTRVIMPVPKGAFVDDGALFHAAYRQERWEELCFIGGVRCYEHVWPVSRCPIVPVPNRHNRNPYPSGDLDDVRPLQRQINYEESKILHHMANSLGDLVFFEEGNGIDRDRLEEVANKPGRHFIPVAPSLDGDSLKIHSISPSPLPRELYLRKEQGKAEIREILGLYEFQQGAVANAPETARGTLQMDEFGQRRIRRKAADHEHALAILGGMVLELAAAYDTEEKVIRLTQPHPSQPGGTEMGEMGVTVNQLVLDEFGSAADRINDLGVGSFDVRCVAGSTLYDNKIAHEQRHLEYFQAGIIDDVEVLKQTALYDTEGVLRRKGMMQQAQSMIQQLQEEVQRLSGDQQTMEREIRHMERKVEEEKFTADLAALKAEAKSDVRVASKRLGDIVQQAAKDVKQQQDNSPTDTE